MFIDIRSSRVTSARGPSSSAPSLLSGRAVFATASVLDSCCTVPLPTPTKRRQLEDAIRGPPMVPEGVLDLRRHSPLLTDIDPGGRPLPIGMTALSRSQKTDAIWIIARPVRSRRSPRVGPCGRGVSPLALALPAQFAHCADTASLYLPVTMQEGRLDRPGTHLPKHWQRHRQRRPHSDILARRRQPAPNITCARSLH